MIESAISFVASVPAAFVDAFNFFVTPTGTLVLLCAIDESIGYGQSLSSGKNNVRT